jgi:hypothetical protein
MSEWFMYDPEGSGYEEFPTEKLAMQAAEAAIKWYLDDGWSEDVVNIVCGKITHKATQCDYVKRPPESEIDEEGVDGEGTWWNSDWDYMCDYKMKPIKEK